MDAMWMMVAGGSQELSLSEALSGISGSISLASWILLLVPQLVENFKNESADGISLAFLFTWFVGDVASLIGAIWAGLIPTVTLLAVYFCFADFVMIAQSLYYRRLSALRAQRASARRHSHHSTTTRNLDDPSQSLLRRSSHSSSRKDSISSARRHSHLNQDTLSPLIEQRPSALSAIIKNIAVVLITCVTGAVGWFIAWKTGTWTPREEQGSGEQQAWGAEVFGYISAILYLGARIPQIHRNYQKKSCEGLSALFFILSLLGNITYGAGILFHSTEREYILNNLPWLIGSLGTMAEDIVIFIQFHIYRIVDEDSPYHHTSTSAIA
ncbi:vacuolar membrane PQ loop repeat protein [Peziza echinospora]|nr:vacuolar membrane PQ loop repeat protein [Peziza echinospora]